PQSFRSLGRELFVDHTIIQKFSHGLIRRQFLPQFKMIDLVRREQFTEMDVEAFEATLRGPEVDVELGVETARRVGARRDGDDHPKTIIFPLSETVKAEFVRVAFHTSDVA